MNERRTVIKVTDAKQKLADAAAKGETKKAEAGRPASASVQKVTTSERRANPYAGINTIPLRQRTEAESTNPYIRALAEQSGKTAGKMAGSAANIYHQALSGAGTPVQSVSAGQGGNVYAQANEQQAAVPAVSRDQARKAYQQALQRNMAAAAADPNSVTPEMQEELRRAEQAMRQADVGPEGRELAFGEKADYVGRNFVGGMLSSTANITNDWTNRAVMAEPIEAMTNTERLKWDPAKQEEIDRVYSEYLAGLTQDEKDYMEITGTMPSREEVYARKMEPEAQKAVDEVELKRWNTWDEPYNQKTQEMFQDAHIGEGLKLAGELAQTTGNQVPAMAVRMIPVVGPALSTTLFFSSAAGAATQEALEAGATNRQAMNYGDAVGIVEAATEKMFDGVSGLLGKGGADELTEVLVGRVAKSDVGRGILRWLAGSAGEGVEEVVSDLFNPLISTLYNGKTVKESYKDLDAGEIFHDYLLGMLSGGLLGSMSFVSGQSRNANQTLNNEAVREAIGKWKDTGTFKAFREAVGAVKSQTEMDNTARGIEKQWKKEAQKAGQDADAYIQERLNGESMEEYARDTIREQEARKEKARELGMKEDQLDRLLFAYGMDSVEELEAMQKRMGDGVPAPFAGAEDVLRGRLAARRNALGEQGATTEGVLNDGENSVRTTPENRDGGIGIREQGQTVGTIKGTQPGGQSEIRQGVQEGGGQNLRSVTLRELGVTNAAEGATINVQDENSLTGPAEAAAQQVRQLGLEPVPYQGDMMVNGTSVNGYIENGRVFFRTDAKYRDGTPISPESIVKHEAIHNARTRDTGIIEAGMELIRQSRSEEQVLAMMDQYRDTYKDIYDFEAMSEAEIQTLMEEELVADAYAGMNYFRAGGETVEQIRAAFEGRMNNQTAERRNETRGPPEGRAQTFIGYDEETGKGIYESNYPENYPAEPKRRRVIELVQNVWSKKPIELVVQNDDGTTQVIQARFDQDYDETGERQTNLGKLAYGNWRGNKKEKRVTLNLADDYYQILQEAKYIAKAENYDDASEINKDVEQWHYFVNQILYQEKGKEERTPYSMYIDVKQTPNGDYVYTFHAEKTEKNNGQTTPQTIPATVNSSENGTANGLPTSSIDEEHEKSNPKNEGRASAEAPAKTLEGTKETLKERFKEYETDEKNLAIAAEAVRDLQYSLFDEDYVSGWAGQRGKVQTGKAGQPQIRTLGRGIRTDLVKDGYVEFRGKTARGPEDIAQMCQCLRDPRFETFRLILTQGDRVVSVRSISSRLPGASTVTENKRSIGAEAEVIRERMRRTGADGYYLVHNHPSGNVDASAADRFTTAQFISVLGRDTYKGHVILDHGTYGLIEDIPDNYEYNGKNYVVPKASVRSIPTDSSVDFLHQQTIEHKALGKQAINASIIAALGKEIQTSDDVSVILYMDSQCNVTQIQEVLNKTFLNNREFNNYMRNQMRDAGARFTALYTTNDDVFNNTAGMVRDGFMVDAIRHKGSFGEDAEYITMRGDYGVEPEEGMFAGLKEEDYRQRIYEPATQYRAGRASAEVTARTAEEYEEDRKKALEYFGTTYNTNEAGYITTDGRYLDFSGRHEGAPGGSRTMDHRDIADAFDGDYGDGSYSGAMVEFMRGGNIRVSPESGGINLMGKPTKQQAAKLEQYIQKFRGEVMLDLDDRNGDTKASVEYPKYTRSSTILQDINDYFDRGIVPKVYENGRASAEVPAEGKLWLDDEATAADAAKAAEDGRTVAMENGSGRIEIRKTAKGNYAVEFYDRAEEAYGERPGSTAMFKTAGEAAEYADAYRDSYQTALEDRELDEARGKPETGKPRGEAGTIPAPFAGTGTTAAEDYNNEVIRQKKAKAAEVNTQTLRERIRRADEELRALRRLDKTTELTEAQKAHKADVQETLEIMNDELERRKAQAKANRGKGKTAKEKPARAVESMPTKSARDARLALQDMFSTRRGAWNETGKAIDEKLAEIARSGKISEESRQELFDILMDNGAVYKEAEEVFRNIRDTVRGSRLYVSEHDRHDFGDNWDSLRKKAFAAGIYLTNDITDQKVNSLVQELGETFGENLFPQDEALSDMLNNLIERSEQGRNTWQPLSESIEDEAKRYREDPQEIFDSMWEQMNRTLQTFAEKADLEIDLKERSAAQLAEERQRWEDRMERRSRARLESEIRGKVLKGLQRLARAKNKTAPDTKAQIQDVLKDIDTQARQITPAGLEDLQGLYRAYEDAKKDAGYQDDENMGNWIPNPYVEERLARLTQKHVNDMSIDEVIELGRTVAALEHSIATQNQMLGEEWDRTITEEAYNVRREVEAAKGAKAGFLHKWAKEEHLSPRRFLEMLGGWTDGTMKKLSHSLEEGQTRMLDFQRRATQSFDTFLSKKENRKWLEKASGKKAEWTKYTVLDGMDEDGGSYVDIELTPMMKISLYLHSRNMDNLRHIQTGGIVIPNKELYRQGKIAEAYAQGQRVKMNPETVRKIAGELTATEKTFANHMTKVFDEISKDAINEVSLQLDGFERAGVDNYMPIETARQFIKSDVAGEARAQTVEGIGSIANERIHASNPIVLSDASDVLMRQIDKVSRYYGYAIPIRNFQAVNNYVFHKEGNAFETSVKELMDRKWGAGAEQYITKMLEDLQSNGRQGDMMSSALAKLRGNLAGATLMFNPSVALSQVASYPGAAQVVGWDGLAAGLTAGKVDTGLMEKYTPLYWYRNQGNSTQELGDYMKDKGLEQKLPWILNWIQKMDSATIRRLWAASEYRVRKDNPGLKPGPQADIDAGTDAYYKAVAEVFNRAVYDTQPNYTNMERAQILRSKSDVTRFLTMYKTVPLQYYGMMVEASGRLEAARKAAKADGSEANQEALRKAQKYAVNTYGGLLAANAAYVTVKALFKGLRGKDKDYRDEEGKLTAGSVSRQLGRDLLETYAGSIIGGAEALDVADSLITGSKFYGPEMSALSYVEDMVNAVQSIVSAAQSEDPRKAAKAVKDGAETLAQGFGVPAKNLETYTIGIIGNLWPEVGVEYANMFGGIDRSNLKGMDEDALGTAAGLILSGRTGEKTDRAVSDELARLYAAGETVAVPTATPQSFSYNGTTVQIKDRGAYSDTWGGIVNDCMEPLMASQDYLDADDSGKASLINRLYEYATVQARKGADSNYTAEGNSTYGWTVKADEAVEAGVPVVDTICALTAFSGMTADKDENGNSISGSKKAKVCDYIDEMDITDEQKDMMYLLAGYKENSLEYTPWHGYVEEEGSGSGKKSGSGKGSKSGRSGGRRRGSGGSSRAVKAKSLPGVGVSGTRRSAGANVPAGNTGGRIQGDVTDRLLEIIDKYYDGNMLAAAFDGGRKARSRIEFEI